MSATMSVSTLMRNFFNLPRHFRSNHLLRGFTWSSSFSSANSTDSTVDTTKDDDGFRFEELDAVLREQGDKLTDDMICTQKNPYEKPHKKCIICQYDVDLDYKNTKLLSQFVSPYTGRIFGRHITGLCFPMQGRISHLIKTARRFGYMPLMFKESTFLQDPSLFDPFKRVKDPEN